MMTVNSSTPVVNVTFRLSDPIPSSVTLQWLHNGDDVVLTPPRITSITANDTAVLQSAHQMLVFISVCLLIMILFGH